MSYYITSQAAIRYYMLAIHSGDREVGGYAKFHMDEHNNCIITELRPIRQESTECYFEISASANGLFLEGIVGEGENPEDWAMLFHTHPEGMSANMSGTDVTMLTEMAKDLPGKVARSIILPQGELHPMIHEAVSIEGRVFMRQAGNIQILDTTKAKEDLKEIGFFDQQKPKPLVQHAGYTSGYGQGSAYAHGAQRSALHSAGAPQKHGMYKASHREHVIGGNREVVPQRQANNGWFDESPVRSESSWLDDSWAQRADDLVLEQELQALDDADDAASMVWDAAESYIGETVIYKGNAVGVIDAYVHSTGVNGDEVVLVLPDNTEVSLAEVTMPVLLGDAGDKAQSA